MKHIKLAIEDTYIIGYDENNKAVCFYPLTKDAKELDLPVLPNPFKESIEKLANEWFEKQDLNIYNSYDKRPSFIAGYKAAQSDNQFLQEKNIQSLFNQQLPKEFILDNSGERIVVGHNGTHNEWGTVLYNIIINSEGKKEICGKYVW